MTTVRTVAHPGWLVVRGPEVDAVVAVGQERAEPLEAAAADGLETLLEELAAEGLAATPDLVACARTETGVRVVLRGEAVVVLPDGTRVGAQGRMPWLDVDLDLTDEEVALVTLEAPEPARQGSRGWQLPARLRPEPTPTGEPSAPDAPPEPAVSSLTELLPASGSPTTEVFPTRPPLGVLRLPSGEGIPLDRGVLLGRAPQADHELPPDQQPHLVRVGGPDRDISRTHAEVVLEGSQVLVRDLGSTNGTTVTLPGEEPVRLRPHEAHGIEPGTLVSLAGEVVLTFEQPE